MSARGRIIGWMLLLIAIALTGSVLATSQILALRAEDLTRDRLERATQNFRTFATSPSGTAHHSVDDLLTRYLEDTVPNRAETAFSVVDGVPHRRLGGNPPVRLDTDEAFIAQVAAERHTSSGSRSGPDGKLRYAIVPVQVTGDPQRGALVIVIFQDELAKPMFESVRIFSLVALVALVFAGIASWLVAGRVLEPVRLVRQAAEQIHEDDLRRRITPTGNDDVGRLAIAFNRMLDRLEQAFATERQFMNDAGHELRTPITVIRGHLELMGDDPHERDQTMALVTDELDRMNRIVAELLILAQAEQPDFLMIESVNLTDLTVDVLSNARMLAADRTWALDEVAEGHARADGQRLTQALMALANNAVQHTVRGDRIGVGSRIDHDRLLLWVSDTGKGVAPEDTVRIFDRFQRGRGAKRHQGTGLGLSIVTSIAKTHGGAVELESHPGDGSTFRLNIPLVPTTISEPDPEPAEIEENTNR